MTPIVPNTIPRFTFAKNQKLCSVKEIEELFSNGSSFYLHPFRIKYHVAPSSKGKCKVLFTVPKRRFKRAVDRNFLKRRLKEGYRLKLLAALNTFCQEQNISLKIAYIYSDNQKLPFDFLENKLILTLERLKQEVLKKIS